LLTIYLSCVDYLNIVKILTRVTARGLIGRYMKKNVIILMLSALSLVLFACTSRLVPPEGPAEATVEGAMLSKADKLLAEKSYDQAVVVYQDYLSLFPESPVAADALMKIGSIEMALGNHEKARNTFVRLIRDYPDSFWIQDAEVEIFSALFNEGKYHELIHRASGIQADAVSTKHLSKIYAFTGDAYMATGSPAEATMSYVNAHNIAVGPDREKITEKLNRSVNYLGSNDIILLLKTLKEPQYIGKFIYLLGLAKKEEQKYEEAVVILSAFIEKFPRHENVPDALRLKEKIVETAGFESFTLGCLLPLSGPYKTFGNKALRGIELALSRFSSSGTGNSIRIVVEDTGADPDRAVLGLQRLYEKRVAAVIGPIITAAPVAVKAQAMGIPIITLSQKEGIADIGDYVFRNFITPEMQVRSVTEYVVKQLGLKRFAILYPDEKYGETFMNLFWDEVLNYGGKIVGVEPYPPDQTDFADPIKKIVGLYYEVPEDLIYDINLMNDEKRIYSILEGANAFYSIGPTNIQNNAEEFDEEPSNIEETDIDSPAGGRKSLEEPKPIVDFEAIFIPDAPQKAGLIMPQLAYYDIEDVYFLGTNLWHSKSLLKMTRRHAQGALMPDGFFAESGSKHVSDFVKVYTETFNAVPEFIEAVSYDTAMILLEIISGSSAQFRNQVRNHLARLDNFNGVTGITSFDENGDVKKDLYLLRVKGSKFVELPASRQATR